MRIYFARHGESQANLLHMISNRQIAHGLTPEGVEQAGRLAAYLQRQHIDRIFTSPLLRAVQTAEVLADQLSIPLKIVDGLREYDCGIAEGRSDAIAWQLWQAQYDAWVISRNYTYQIEGGESFSVVQSRFIEFINQVKELYGGTPANVVCISHGGIYSVMLPLILSNITNEMVMKYGFGYTSWLVAEQISTGLKCIEWNQVSIQ